jgi:hypothetical protein
MGQHAGIVPMIENIKFCKISTHIQDVLAQSPVLHTNQRLELDRELVSWYENLPWILRSTEPCPESFYTARCIMKWRYQNLRIVLHRPVLLNLASSGNEAQASQDDLEAVSRCRILAKQTIEEIAHEWTPNQMLGWNGVWFMYQASMIPLVSMFWESWNTPLVRDCQAQIEVVLEAFEGMADWSLAARRSREVLLKMYEASKRPMTGHNSPRLGPIKGENGVNGNVLTPPSPMNGMPTMHGVDGMAHMMHGMNPMNGHMMNAPEMHQMEMMGGDEMAFMHNQGVWDLDGMFWGGLPDGLDMPYEGVNMDYNDGGMQHYDGNYMMMHQ